MSAWQDGVKRHQMSLLAAGGSSHPEYVQLISTRPFLCLLCWLGSVVLRALLDVGQPLHARTVGAQILTCFKMSVVQALHCEDHLRSMNIDQMFCCCFAVRNPYLTL